MNKLYYWAPDAESRNVGHASLDISFGKGPTMADYVSFWPNGKLVKTPSVSLHNYPGDCDGEGGDPDMTVEIDCLDEDRMRVEWQTIRARSTYNLFGNNCSTMVAHILEIGGAKLSREVNQMYRNVPLWTPRAAITRGQAVQSNKAAILRQRQNGFVAEPPSILDALQSLPMQHY